MKGIDILYDEKGKPKAALVNLRKWGKEFEDFFDGIVSSERMKESPRVKWKDLKKEIDAERVKLR